MKIHLKDATLIEIKSLEESKIRVLGKVLHATVVKDEMNELHVGVEVLTSTIKYKGKLEYHSDGGVIYIVESPPEQFDVSIDEFVLMRDCAHSPQELIELRNMFQLR